MKDSFGRVIDYARISVTKTCNMRCEYCMPLPHFQMVEDTNILSDDEILTILSAMSEIGISKIRLTGGEPLCRTGIPALIGRMRDSFPAMEITMTTNGVLLEKYAGELKRAGLNRVNISLDSLDAKRYQAITGSDLLPEVLRGIAAAQAAGFEKIRLNTVLLRGINEVDILPLITWTLSENIDVRFIELMPIGRTKDYCSEHFFSAQAVLDRVAELVPEPASHLHEASSYFRLPGGKGRVGLIRPLSCKFCSSCNRIRVTAEGVLKPCLLSDQRVSLREYSDGCHSEELVSAIRRAVLNKPAAHLLEQQITSDTSMYCIGG